MRRKVGHIPAAVAGETGASLFGILTNPLRWHWAEVRVDAASERSYAGTWFQTA